MKNFASVTKFMCRALQSGHKVSVCELNNICGLLSLQRIMNNLDTEIYWPVQYPSILQIEVSHLNHVKVHLILRICLIKT